MSNRSRIKDLLIHILQAVPDAALLVVLALVEWRDAKLAVELLIALLGLRAIYCAKWLYTGASGALWGYWYSLAGAGLDYYLHSHAWI